MDIALLRDILIIFGIISGFILFLTGIILVLIIFVRVKRIIRYIESSISEIDSLRNKIKEAVPKPFSDIINGALTIKKFTNSLTKKSANKKKVKTKKEESSKKGKEKK
jgi:cell shape-determining protein MreC